MSEWRALDDLLDRLYEADSAGRQEILGKLEQTDADLAAAARRLLESADSDVLEPGGALATGVLAGFASSDPAATAGRPQRIGAWRITRELGRGGMGVVYLAERAGSDFEQTAAIKLLPAGPRSDELLHRFEQERRILAGLDHPGIARLIDGGVTDDGAPWFAMEYVEGERIDTYCDRKRLSIDERLKLFNEVADAVQAAHRSLVVHRDLKPANILVTEDGAVKLLDFGIAKPLAGEGITTEATQTLQRVLTPEYSSPEQIRGSPVTTASDVYQLGLLLHELLTGRRAHAITDSTPQGVERAVCDEAPTRASVAAVRPDETEADGERPESLAAARRTTPNRLQRRLRGDLDIIVLTALRKEPERRYASAEQMADDVRRHLGALPVRARPDTVGYRTGRFVRRHVVGVASSAAMFLLIAALVTYYTTQLQQERDRARAEAGTAEQVADFLEELFAAPDPIRARGSDVTAREILDDGVDRIRGELENQPRVRARLLFVLGRTYSSIGLEEEAIDLLQEAMEVGEKQLGSQHPDTLRAMRQLGRSVVDRQLRQAHGGDMGQMAEGEEMLREALQRAESSLGFDHPVTLTIRSDLGLARLWQDDLDSAETLQAETLAGRRRVLGDEHADTLASLNNLAIVYQTQGRLDQAEPLLREAVGVGSRVLGRDHPWTLDALNNLATTLARRGLRDEAIDLYREVIELRRRVLGRDHPRTVRTMVRLAMLYAESEHFTDAEVLLNEVVDIHGRSLGKDHSDTLWSMHRLADVLLQSGQLKRARELASEVLDRRQTVFGTSHVGVLWAKILLGAIADERGRFEEAEQFYREAADGFVELQGVDSRSALSTNLFLADSLTSQGRHDEAARILVQVRQRANEKFPDDSSLHASLLMIHGRHLRATGRLPEAEETLRAAAEKAASGSQLARQVAAELVEIDALQDTN